MTSELFMTGATGFIGSSLLQTWLDRSDARVTVLVRAKRGETPQQRVPTLLNGLYPGGVDATQIGRVSVVEGDLTQARLGLTDGDYGDLVRRVTHIAHCGAAVRFDLPLEEARRANVGGTRSILELAAACRNLERLDYVGTAYVAGQRRGVITEQELDQGQVHNNTYERSKCESEQAVREAMGKLPIAIFRPSIVLGDSRTGRVAPFSAFFRVFRMYHRGHLRALPGDPAAAMDLVSLDYAAGAIFEITRHPQSVGRCFHVSAGIDNLTTLGDIAEWAALHFKRDRFLILPPAEFERRFVPSEEKMSEEARKMIEEIRLYSPYLLGTWRFDDANTRAMLRETGLHPPEVRNYFDRMVAYVTQHG